jgi:D-xylose transport system permease protein
MSDASFKLNANALRAYMMLIVLALIWAFFHWQTGGTFLGPRNLSNLMAQTAVTGVLAVGMLMVILAGQIDLSVGSVLGVAGMVMALLMSKGWGLGPALLVGVAIGVGVGAFSGSLVAYANIPAFIVTLGGLLSWRGVVKGVSQGATVPVTLAPFKSIGQQYLAPAAGWALAGLALAVILWSAISKARAAREHGLHVGAGELALGAALPSVGVLAFVWMMNAYAGVPISVLIFLAVALAGAFLTQQTTFGRYLYAIGGNPEAARLSGINIQHHIVAVYCLLGALVGIAAAIYTAQNGSASPDAGVLKELDAVAACVIGGASLMGGRGSVFGACIGALIMQSLDNGMSLLNVQDFLKDIIKGQILVAAVGLDMLGRKR